MYKWAKGQNMNINIIISNLVFVVSSNKIKFQIFENFQQQWMFSVFIIHIPDQVSINISRETLGRLHKAS